MKENIISFVNKLEGFKTAIKNLHWSSSNMSEHKLFDDIADSVAGVQDEISEIEQGLHGQIEKNKLQPISYKIESSKQFLKDVISATNSFYSTIDGEEYIGMRSEVEAFLGEMNKFQYLLNLCLKEDLKRRMNSNLNESSKHNQSVRLSEQQLYKVIEESVRRILKEHDFSDALNTSNEEDFYNEIDATNKCLNNKGNSAQARHPQTTPFASIYHDDKPQHMQSFNTTDYLNPLHNDESMSRWRERLKELNGF